MTNATRRPTMRAVVYDRYGSPDVLRLVEVPCRGRARTKVLVRVRATTVGRAARRRAPGVYNIVDDKPAPMREWLSAYAETIGAKRSLGIPA